MGDARKECRRVLFVLQNAYDKGTLSAGYSPSRWRKEFRTSRTAARLRIMCGGTDLMHYRFANTTPDLGEGSGSKLPPIREHVRDAIRHNNLNVVVACGQQAFASSLGLVRVHHS